MSVLSREALFYLFHHVFLPPKLPSESDVDLGLDDVLCEVVSDALGVFLRSMLGGDRTAVQTIKEMVENTRRLHAGSMSTIIEDELEQSLRRLLHQGGFLALRISAQNAGLVVSAIDDVEDRSLLFECFELSPTNEAVFGTRGRLRRSFPGGATTVKHDVASDPSFIAAVAESLALMSHQKVGGQQPRVKKAGNWHEEDRDTTHPGVVSEFFYGFLTSIGEPAGIPALRKHCRDEVMYSKGRFPWRRSPTWQLLRVSIQIAFARLQSTVGTAKDLYKHFMVFLMANILQKCTESALSSSVLFSMNMKLMRRLWKLHRAPCSDIMLRVTETMCGAHSLLRRRWADIQARQNSIAQFGEMKTTNFEEDSHMFLPELDEFINSMARRKQGVARHGYHPEKGSVRYLSAVLPDLTLSQRPGISMIQELHFFERWVAVNLTDWVTMHLHIPDVCNQLSALLAQYHTLALPHYSGNPEATSVMLLVLMELWVACDKVALSVCPLLSQYKPGIRKDPLQNLLLPSQEQMARLDTIEKYLDHRARAKYSTTLLFGSVRDANGFAARYFDQSSNHQALHQKIITMANVDRDHKVRELDRLKNEYARLQALFNSNTCEFRDVLVDADLNIFHRRHHPACKHCAYERSMAKLQIHVHEWPLPNTLYAAKTVVFELEVPTWYGHWRESTTCMRFNVFKEKYLPVEKYESKWHLSSDPHLSRLYRPSSPTQPRIGLLSNTKPHVGTHRSGKLVATATEADVCVANGLTYRYIDVEHSAFITDSSPTQDVLHACTYQLPRRSQSMQSFVFRPADQASGPAPNSVIARQYECPHHLALSEFKQLASVPLGYELQWWNIALEIGAPSVDFKKAETTLVFLQCIYQAGPPCMETGPSRPSHTLPTDNTFASMLLENLNGALDRISKSWDSLDALSTFVAIATRVVSINASDDVRHEYCNFLDKARRVSWQWILQLKDKAYNADSTDSDKFLARCTEAALACASTFDVDGPAMSTILQDMEAASTLLQCAIVVHEGHRFIETTCSHVAYLHVRHQRVLCNAYEILAKAHVSLDDAVGKSWSGFRPGRSWKASRGSTHWMTTSTKTSSDAHAGLTVHLNLLSGELLVNGLPLHRLPSTYEEHSSYKTLFGKSTIAVMPSDAAGMEFSSKQRHRGFQLNFGMGSDETNGAVDLLVRALGPTAEDSGYELVPSRFLLNHVPTDLVTKYVHWFNIKTGQVEFRNAADPWQRDASPSWILKQQEGSTWQLSQPSTDSLLIHTKSETALALSRVLKPLTNPLLIFTVLDRSRTTISASIPHLRLTFVLRKGQSSLQSREFTGACVDIDQSIGTLLGFENKLLLKDEATSERTVLVLEGEVLLSSGHKEQDRDGLITNGHVHAYVDRATATKVLPFRVDSQLGRLLDNGDLQSKLTLAYLHALTSHCLCDPLTKLTGSEQALMILRSAAVRSFDRLTVDNVKILLRIASLTPRRSFYPVHERVMQDVKWSSHLSFLSQRADYYQIVESIFKQSQKWDFLYSADNTSLPDLKGVHPHLLARDRIRSSTFYAPGFGAEDFTITHDAPYKARDHDRSTNLYRHTYTISSKVFYQDRTNSYSSATQAKLWEFLRNSIVVQSPDRNIDLRNLKYDGSLFGDKSSVVAEKWMSLFQTLRSHARSLNRFGFMIWLSGLASSETMDVSIVEAMASFYTSADQFRAFTGESRSQFTVYLGCQVTQIDLCNLISSCERPPGHCPEKSWTRRKGETGLDFNKRKELSIQSNQKAAKDQLASALLAQWPTSSPSSPALSNTVHKYIDVERAVKLSRQFFADRKHNLDLYAYLAHIADGLRGLGKASWQVPQQTCSSQNMPFESQALISQTSLFSAEAPTFESSSTLNHCTPAYEDYQKNTAQVQGLVESLRQKPNQTSLERDYVHDLQASVTSLQRYTWHQPKRLPSVQDLESHLQACQHQLNEMECILASCEAPHKSPEIASLAHQIHALPRSRPLFFLQQLHRNRWISLRQDWKDCILRYVLAHHSLQQSKRLVRAAIKGDDDDLSSELRNVGHENWSPEDSIEWLLLEVESNITIRAVQVNIAHEMIAPQQERNTSMQLNMGEGKSAVIVPITVASLTDGSKLVRVIVAKAQSKQMTQMLISKLGGLLDRQVYYIPFSRGLQFSEKSANLIRDACNDCKTTGAVLLMQPEHILSFQLMCLESCISGDESLGLSLASTQLIFQNHARDIIDESDENFSVKYELIYTMGMQRQIEMSPSRWTMAQHILDLVCDVVTGLARERPNSIELHGNQMHAFPRIRLLDEDVEVSLAHRLAIRVCEVGMAGLAIARQIPDVRRAVFTYITQLDMDPDEVHDVSQKIFAVFTSEDNKMALLLLRGLLAGGIIGFVLRQKRWRVNYGLDKLRSPMTQLAVPYRAKDVPSARSEFSHPDVVILLTCLSYYYAGLDDDLVQVAFEHLMDSDQREVEYREWIRGVTDLDPCFRQTDGVNLKDRTQCSTHVFPPLRHSKAMIDYYLGRFVFPKEMKEFPSKLSASGWDLGRKKHHPTSAFSGTIDSKTLLPLDVHHLSLRTQGHTNALVLDHLLKEENGVTLYQTSGTELIAQCILDHIMALRPSPRVILDVGAQILEMSNQSMAQTWLAMQSQDELKGAVFIDGFDVVSVIDRNGFVEPLQTSPFANQLGSCLVYLDEAHTRGIDLKLPPHYRAAVTLGANLTKDRLVQACMRMRKLGQRQSVVFCVSPEIRTKITQCTHKPDDANITVADILEWAVQESCSDIQRSLPLWAIQGRRFIAQQSLWDIGLSNVETTFSQRFATQFLEKEAQSLQDRYDPLQVEKAVQSRENCVHPRIIEIDERLRTLGSSRLLESTLYEEQERELSPELERERQIERAKPAKPADHQFHKDVEHFVLHGGLRVGSPAYMDAFQALASITAAVAFDVSQLRGSGRLLVTTDFVRTIRQTSKTDSLDSFQRSVQWLLTSTVGESNSVAHIMIISPFEAQRVVPRLRSRGTNVALHGYRPCWNLEHVAFDGLQGFSIPILPDSRELTSSLAAQMNLFAGRLYFRSANDYRHLCMFLGLALDQSASENEVTSDGFILDQGRRTESWPGLETNPVPFVNAMLRIRRDGEGFAKTHMGRLVDGDLRLLQLIMKDTGCKE